MGIETSKSSSASANKSATIAKESSYMGTVLALADPPNGAASAASCAQGDYAVANLAAVMPLVPMKGTLHGITQNWYIKNKSVAAAALSAALGRNACTSKEDVLQPGVMKDIVTALLQDLSNFVSKPPPCAPCMQ